MSKSIVYTDHSAIKYLFAKKVCYGKTHGGRLENPHQDKLENKEINEAFPLETLGSVALQDQSTPWTFQSLHSRTTGEHYGVPIHSRKGLRFWIFWPTSIRMPMTSSPVVDIVNVKGKITQRDEMPKTPSKFADIFWTSGH
ncbi:hypothetical protein Tco_0490964 [Tanacetum coccineum]